MNLNRKDQFSFLSSFEHREKRYTRTEPRTSSELPFPQCAKTLLALKAWKGVEVWTENGGSNMVVCFLYFSLGSGVDWDLESKATLKHHRRSFVGKSSGNHKRVAE